VIAPFAIILSEAKDLLFADAFCAVIPRPVACCLANGPRDLLLPSAVTRFVTQTFTLFEGLRFFFRRLFFVLVELPPLCLEFSNRGNFRD